MWGNCRNAFESQNLAFLFADISFSQSKLNCSGAPKEYDKYSNQDQNIVDTADATSSLCRGHFLILTVWLVAAFLHLPERSDHSMVFTDRIVAMLAIFNFLFATRDAFVWVFSRPLQFHLKHLLVLVLHQGLLNSVLTVEIHFYS